MNCDEAFDALTDPEQASNRALAWHLEFCPRCREMQNVLAPALGLLAEGTLAAERDSTQKFRCPTPNRVSDFLEAGSAAAARPPRGKAKAPFLTPEAVQVAEQIAQRLRSPRRRLGSFWTRFAVTAAVCLCAAFGVTFTFNPAEPAPPRPQSEPLRLADQCLWTNRGEKVATASTEPPSSRWVVMSCVSCHLEHSLE